MAEDEKTRKFSDLMKVSWIRSAVILGIILTIIGLTIIYLLKYFNVSSSPLFLDAKVLMDKYGLLGVFAATILAGTLVPLGSPALVVAAAALGMHKIHLVLVATIGFTLGMLINYALAYRLGRPYVTRKVSAERLDCGANNVVQGLLGC